MWRTVQGSANKYFVLKLDFEFLPSALTFGRSYISRTDLKVLVLVERLRIHMHKVLCTLNLF